jgi:hypothetical protein
LQTEGDFLSSSFALVSHVFQRAPDSFALTQTAQAFNLRAWDVHRRSIELDFTHANSPRMTIKNQNNKNHKIVP